MKKVFAGVAFSTFMGLSTFAIGHVKDGSQNLQDFGVPEAAAKQFDFVEDLRAGVFTTLGCLVGMGAMTIVGSGGRRREDPPSPNQP